MTSGKTDIQTFYCLFTQPFVSRSATIRRKFATLSGRSFILSPTFIKVLCIACGLGLSLSAVALSAWHLLTFNHCRKTVWKMGRECSRKPPTPYCLDCWHSYLLAVTSLSQQAFERMYSDRDASAHGYLAIYPFLRYRATPLKTY